MSTWLFEHWTRVQLPDKWENSNFKLFLCPPFQDYCVAWWLMIHTQLYVATGGEPVHRIGMLFFVPPILATLFILGLFPLSVNLITDQGDTFGADEDSHFKKRLLFIIISLQFLPSLISLGLMVGTTVPEGTSNSLLVEQFISSLLFLTAALLLKFGNYHKQESEYF